MEDNREIDEWPGFSPSNIVRGEARFIVFSPDKKKFIVAAPANIDGREGWSVDIWDYEKKKLIATERIFGKSYYFLAWINNQEYASWHDFGGREGIVFSKLNGKGIVEKTYNEAMSNIVIEKAITGSDTSVKLKMNPYTLDIIMIVSNVNNECQTFISGWDSDTKAQKFLHKLIGRTLVYAFFPNATEMVLLEEGCLPEKKENGIQEPLVTVLNTDTSKIKTFKNIGSKPEYCMWDSWGYGDWKDSKNKISEKYDVFAHLDQRTIMTSYCVAVSSSKIFICDLESGILDIKDFGVRIGEKQ